MKLLFPAAATLLVILNYGSTALLGQTAGSQTFIAPGISPGDPGSSEHFYDNGKGYYWQWDKLQEAAHELYQQTGSWDFLGELSSRVPEGAVPSSEPPFYANLTEDANTCWYNASSNILQYWQDYYGVFYQGNGDAGSGSTTLPHGYTYNQEQLDTLAGTQSLRIDMLFYDNWADVGGNLGMSASWYLAGSTSDPNLTGQAGAGFFREFFTSPTDSYVIEYEQDGLTLTSITELLVSGFGLTETPDGTLTQNTPGQIVTFDINSATDNSGHAITCYGFSLDASGNVSSILIANSDDLTYGLETLYLGADEQGCVYLYRDAACTQRWDYSDLDDWQVVQIGYIKTPETLQDMYAQYTDADTPLVWNGQQQGSPIWTATRTDSDTAGELPTETTGWDVYVTEGEFSGYYHAYADPSRPVEFGDHGQGGDITVEGAVSTPRLILSGQSADYHFSGSATDSITADVLQQTGTGSNSFSHLSLYAARTLIDSGQLILGSEASLSGETGTIRGNATLILDGGSLHLPTLSIRDSAELAVTSLGGLLDGSLTMAAGTTLSFELSDTLEAPLLTLTGNLTLEGAVYLDLSGSLTSGTSYQLIGFTGTTPENNWETLFQSYDGTLTLSNNTLVLHYQAPRTLTWDSGSGSWSASQWNSTSESSDGATVTFTRQGATPDPATITVYGKVSPGSIEITGGEYQLIAGEGAVISGDRDVTISQNAQVTTALNFTGRRVELRDTAALTYAVEGASDIRSLETAEGTQLTFTGKGSLYTLLATGGLNGSLQVEDATLEFQLLSDTTIAATLSTNSTAALSFRNASATTGITYTLTQGTDAISGTIRIGSDEDTHTTTLNLSSDTAATYELTSRGVLSLHGASVFSGSATGTGRIEIAEGAHIGLAPNRANANKLNLAESVSLLIRGEASAGSASSDTGYLGGSDANIEIQGGTLIAQVNKLQTYSNKGGQNTGAAFAKLSLNQGDLIFNLTSSSDDLTAYSYSPLANLQELQITGDNNELTIVQDTGFPGANIIDVERLSGNGTLLFTSDKAWLTPQVLKISDTADSSRVDLVITAQADIYHIDYLGSAAVEIQAGELGDVTLRHSGTSDHTRAGLGIAGDVTIGALSSTESSSYLYAGQLIPSPETLFGSDTDGSNQGIARNIKAESHTLTIDSDSYSEFEGSILKGTGSGSDSQAALSITKKGTGTQILNGKIEGLQGGNITLEEGALGICHDLIARDVILASGTTLATDHTFAVTGTFQAGENTCLTTIADEPSEATFDLSQANMLALSGTVDLVRSCALTLGGTSPIPLTLQGDFLNLWESTGELTLFANATQLTLGGKLYTDESAQFDAALYLSGSSITEGTILTYDGATHSLTLRSSIPEPTTAALSLLAMAGMLSRRRRHH